MVGYTLLGKRLREANAERGPDVAVPPAIRLFPTRAVDLPRLYGAHPQEVRQGAGFNPQPDDRCALVLLCRDAERGSVVLFDGERLPTSLGNASWVTATMPRGYIERPGVHEVRIANSAGDSNPVRFRVLPRLGRRRPAATAPLVLAAAFPSQLTAVRPFNARPDGRSTIAVRCLTAASQAVILLDGTPLPTFHRDGLLSAVVPWGLLRPGTNVDLWVRDGRRESGRLVLPVTD